MDKNPFRFFGNSVGNNKKWQEIKDQMDKLVKSSSDREALIEIATSIENIKLEKKLNPEKIEDPASLVESKLDEIGDDALLAIGESGHHDSGTLEFEINLISSLSKKRKVERIFLEEDITMMPQVESYYETNVMSETLKEYLTKGFVRADTPGHEYKLTLIKNCKELNIPVSFIDSNDLEDRDKDWGEKIKKEIGNKIQGLHILIAGKNHTSHNKNTYLRGSIPVVAHLDSEYKGKVISLTCQGAELDLLDRAQKIPEVKFFADLKKISRDNLPSAIAVKGSPYEDLPLSISQLEAKMATSFDIMVNIPGENLDTNSI